MTPPIWNSAHDVLKRFEHAARLALDLRMATKRRHAPSDLFVEAEIRLEQTWYFLRRFRELEEEHTTACALMAQTQPEDDTTLSTRIREIGDEIKANGEAFYYFAFRAYKALAAIGVSFNPRGVIVVRNKLIEHPHNQSGGVLVSHWMWDCPQGLVLMPGGIMGEITGPDAGLYPNAHEYIEALMPVLERAVSLKLAGPGHVT